MMARSTESPKSSETKMVVVSNEGGDSVLEPKSSPTENQKDKNRILSGSTSTSGNKRRNRSGCKSKPSNKQSLPVPRRATTNSSSNESFAEKTALHVGPRLSSSPGSSSGSPPSTLSSNGPTFAQIATRPIRVAKLIMSKITVELTGQEFYLVKDDQDNPFLLDKDMIQSKYSHLLQIYRASIRGKRNPWMRGKLI